MKKMAAFVLTAVLFFANAPIKTTYAFDIPQQIRVGLTYKYNEVDAVAISNQNILVGYEMGNQFFEAATLTCASGFSMAYTNLFYVRLGQEYDNYTDAKQAATQIDSSSSYKSTPCLVGINTWAVYIGESSTEAEALAINNNIIENSSVVKSNAKKTVLKDGGIAVIIFDNAELYPQIGGVFGEHINLGDRKFRQRVEFGRYSGAKLNAVNVLSLNEYLYSVVPSEMPSLWHIEALKAQACAARNYAVTGMGKHAAQGYDMCDSTHCQVFIGASHEAESSTKAVEDTSGMIIYHDSQPISAVFFSSSGGMTEDSENVWQNSSPYLKSVVEVNESQAKQWTRVISLAELDKVLANNNANIGNATGIHIGSYDSAGRVGELVITGTKGSKSLVKEEIRNYFASLSGKNLESRNFSISNGNSTEVKTNLHISNEKTTTQITSLNSLSIIGAGNDLATVMPASEKLFVVGSAGTTSYSVAGNDIMQTMSSNDGSDIVIIGKGWGHAVGLSQYGAKGMAEQGYTFDQILKHYYTNVEIK